MKFKQVVAGAAVGCALGASRHRLYLRRGQRGTACNPGPGVQCGPGGGRAARAQRDRGGPPQGGDRGGPPGQHSAFAGGPAGNPGTRRQPGGPRRSPWRHPRTGGGGPGGPPGDFRGPAAEARTSAGPTTTIGGRRGTPATTTGAVGSTAPHGVAACRRGAGAHRRRRRGTDRSRRRGGRRRRPSTTGASTSSRCGIPATTSGASISSGSGFRSRSDVNRPRWPSRLPGRPSSIHLSE